MTASPWPPPAGPSDLTTVVHVATYVEAMAAWGSLPATARVVTLWGRQVAIDVDGRVHCGSCMTFIDVAELATADNQHRPGLPASTYPFVPVDVGQPANTKPEVPPGARFA